MTIKIHFTQDGCMDTERSYNRNKIVYPEIQYGKPLTPSDLIARAPKILSDGAVIFTTSEHLVLCVLKMVRDKKISPDNIEIREHFYSTTEKYPTACISKVVPVDEEGCIDRSSVVDSGGPSGFFSERLALLR